MPTVEFDPSTADFAELENVALSVSSKVARKRALEDERRGRILNAKVRTIGIEVEKLDEQCAARKASEEAAKTVLMREEHMLLQVDNRLKMLEIERKRMHEEATKDVVEFNNQFLQKSDRREYDLSDPHALKKEVALKEEDLGPSGMQRMAGEDCDFRDRQRAQRAQQAQWLEQQVYEKRMRAELGKQDEADFALSQKALLDLRSALEKEEQQLRKEITSSALDYNATKRREKEEEKKKNGFSRAVDEKIRDYREMASMATSEFLNQTTSQYNANGRIRRDHFRGAPKEHYYVCAAQQTSMKEDRATQLELAKAEDREFDAQAEQTRRALVGMEKERQKEYNETVHREMHTNKVVEGKNKIPHGVMEDVFFEQFGTGGR